jgi:hypothetical protein
MDKNTDCYKAPCLYGTRLIKSMRGGSRSLLILDQRGVAWVVKFSGNPQHRNLILNEHLAGGVASLLKLTVPASAPIWISEQLASEIQLSVPKHDGIYVAGLHFASRYVGGLMPGLVVNMLPGDSMAKVTNIDELAGIKVLDLWLQNTDERQAVLARKWSSKSYRAYWIDFGNCFGRTRWNADNHWLTRHVLETTPCWLDLADYEPWIQRIEQLSFADLMSVFNTVPESWRRGREADLDGLAQFVDASRWRVRSLIVQFLEERRKASDKSAGVNSPFIDPGLNRLTDHRVLENDEVPLLCEESPLLL